ncbi:MAG: cation transporter [Saprospiraceae bacterium]
MKNIVLLLFVLGFWQLATAQQPTAPKEQTTEKSTEKNSPKADEKACMPNDKSVMSGKKMIRKKAAVSDKWASTQFKVWGNCGMCKKTIEKSAMAVNGVKFVDWDMDTHQFTLKYDASLTSVEAVHKAIAAAGYDTDLILGDDKAYKNLHACCQYERREQ